MKAPADLAGVFFRAGNFSGFKNTCRNQLMVPVQAEMHS